MNTKQFVNKYGIKISCVWADENKNAPGWKEANHFKVTLRAKGKQLSTYFSQGYGIAGEPTAESVLEALAFDSAGIENARSFEEWASEYGYDTDSRRAEQIYKICEKQADKLKRFLGDELYEILLWKVRED